MYIILGTGATASQLPTFMLAFYITIQAGANDDPELVLFDSIALSIVGINRERGNCVGNGSKQDYEKFEQHAAK